MKITKEQLKAIMPNIEGNIKKNKHFAGMTLDSVTEPVSYTHLRAHET